MIVLLQQCILMVLPHLVNDKSYLSKGSSHKEGRLYLAKDIVMRLINERAKIRYCYEKTRDEFEHLYERTTFQEDQITKVPIYRRQLKHELQLNLQLQKKNAFFLFMKKEKKLQQSLNTLRSEIMSKKMNQLAIDKGKCQEILNANNSVLSIITTMSEERLKQRVHKYEVSRSYLLKSIQRQEKTFEMLVVNHMLRKRKAEEELSHISVKRPFLISQKESLESDHRVKHKQNNSLKEEKSKSVTLTKSSQESWIKETMEGQTLVSFLQNLKALSIRNQYLLQNKVVKTRNLLNRLQDLKGNLRVFCRIRPLILSEQESIDFNISELKWTLKESITVYEGATDRNLGKSVKRERKKYTFHFDKIFSPFSSNPDIFQEISQIIQCSLEGSNTTIFAYGPTGSGKSFTMSKVNDGLISRSVDLLFDKRNNDIQIFAQFIEIYNDKLFNLLEYKRSKSYDIRHNEAHRTTEILGMDETFVDSKRQMEKLLLKAEQNKRTSFTCMNERSSRSHTVVRFIFRSRQKNCLLNTLHLIDLAGSERISQSKVTGDRLKETQSINKSLSCLNNVIHSIHQNYHHIPYRNSKLTYLLQYSLEPRSKTLMFVNVSPNTVFFRETLTSLRFAEKVNDTKVTKYDF